MTKIIAVAMHKGGTGKTTTTLNLGAALFEKGKKVLLVDFDPGADLTKSYGLVPLELKLTVYKMLFASPELIDQVIIRTTKGPDLIPSNLDLAGAEAKLMNDPNREKYLKEKLDAIRERYDFILIDCPPSLTLLTINALSAADMVLIPVQCQYYALTDLKDLAKIIQTVKIKTNPHIEVAGILPTMYEGRTRHCREVHDELKRTLAGALYDIVIKRSIKFADAVVNNPNKACTKDADEPLIPLSILRYDPKSIYADSYRKLAEEVLKNDE